MNGHGGMGRVVGKVVGDALWEINVGRVGDGKLEIKRREMNR